MAGTQSVVRAALHRRYLERRNKAKGALWVRSTKRGKGARRVQTPHKPVCRNQQQRRGAAAAPDRRRGSEHSSGRPLPVFLQDRKLHETLGRTGWWTKANHASTRSHGSRARSGCSSGVPMLRTETPAHWPQRPGAGEREQNTFPRAATGSSDAVESPLYGGAHHDIARTGVGLSNDVAGPEFAKLKTAVRRLAEAASKNPPSTERTERRARQKRRRGHW